MAGRSRAACRRAPPAGRRRACARGRGAGSSRRRAGGRCRSAGRAGGSSRAPSYAAVGPTATIGRVSLLLLVDLDGVVYRGSEPVPGVAAVLADRAARGDDVVYVTNNSMHYRADYVTRLSAMGAPITPETVVSSARATALHIANHEPGIRRVLVLGASGLERELRDVGLDVVTVGHAATRMHQEGIDGWAAAGRPGCRRHRPRPQPDVPAARRRPPTASGPGPGSSPRTATRSIRRSAACQPGAGTVAAALEATTGVVPLSIGKPEPHLLELAAEAVGRTASEAIMIGDGIGTDLAAARAVGRALHLHADRGDDPGPGRGAAAGRAADRARGGCRGARSRARTPHLTVLARAGGNRTGRPPSRDRHDDHHPPAPDHPPAGSRPHRRRVQRLGIHQRPTAPGASAAASPAASPPASGGGGVGMVDATGDWRLSSGTNAGAPIPIVPDADITMTVDGQPGLRPVRLQPVRRRDRGQGRPGPVRAAVDDRDGLRGADHGVRGGLPRSARQGPRRDPRRRSTDADAATASSSSSSASCPPRTADLVETDWILDSLITA